MPAATSAKWPFISSSAHEAQDSGQRCGPWDLSALMWMTGLTALLTFPAAEQLLCPLEVRAAF